LFTPLLFSKIDFLIFPRQVFKKRSGAAVLSFRQYLKFLIENGENRSPLINASRPPSAILSIANEVPPPSFHLDFKVLSTPIQIQIVNSLISNLKFEQTIRHLIMRHKVCVIAIEQSNVDGGLHRMLSLCDGKFERRLFMIGMCIFMDDV
jgi:hypothetical protein